MPFTAFNTLVRRPIVLGSVAAVAALSVGGATAGYAALNNDITLSLDGEQKNITVMADTVGEVLDAEGIDLGDHDRVAPGLDEQVSDGSAITVRFGREFSLTVDGKEKTYWVTATTVEGALQEIGRTYAAADLSASRGDAVSRSGAELEVITPKTVRVKLGGKKMAKRTVIALNVQDVLDELDVKVQKADSVKPGLKAKVVDGDKIVFTDIRVVTKRARNQSISFETVERDNADLLEGKTKVVRAGRAGVRDVTSRVRYKNGEQVKTSVVKSAVVRKPVDQIVEVGTKEPKPEPAPAPAPAPAANYSGGGTVWDALARCESGGNWAINTGNGYYGGLQFSLPTWRSHGGTGYPHRASRSTQIAIAQRVKANQGWGAWPHCTSKLGLR